MKENHNKEEFKEAMGLPCSSCGNQLRYNAEIKKLKCDYCGNIEDLDRRSDQIVENDLNSFLKSVPRFVPEKNDQSVFDCSNCGAKFTLPSSTVNVDCAFCGSKNVNKEAFEHNYIQPAGIAPFEVTDGQALDFFKAWIKKGWFHPNKLKKIAKADAIHGIYIPSWTFDANSHSSWSGQAGYYYYVTETYTVNGETRTRQVQKVRWVSRNGQFNNSFDDVLVSASKGLSQEYLSKVEPFRLYKAINFNPKLLVGWESEIYGIELNHGYTTAEGKMDAANRSKASSALGGDTQRGLRVNSTYSDQTFKLLLLPLWMASYTFNGKQFSFVVNGQTGKVHGKKPISAWKIFFLILTIAAIAFTIYILEEKNIINLQ